MTQNYPFLKNRNTKKFFSIIKKFFINIKKIIFFQKNK